MCCFVMPLIQGIAVSSIRKSKSREIKDKTCSHFMQQLPKLETMLWGGTVMLIVDHIINGEVTWRYPFFTALEQAGGAHVMLREMLTVGLPMCGVITLVWAGLSFASALHWQR